jgi:hypothetical protein
MILSIITSGLNGSLGYDAGPECLRSAHGGIHHDFGVLDAELRMTQAWASRLIAGSHLLIVDLNNGCIDSMLVACAALSVDDAEELSHGPEVDPWVFWRPFHCVSLARSCLPISKYADIVPAMPSAPGYTKSGSAKLLDI